MPTLKLVVETGPNAGQTFEIKRVGASIGRSNKNDIVIADAQLSRHHCKVFFLGDDLWISDLATLNGTLINGVAIQEDAKLTPGDRIAIGDTTLRLEDTQRASRAASAPSAKPGAPIDLGFNTAPPPPSAGATPNARKTLRLALIAFLAVCGLAIVVKLMLGDSAPAETATPAVAAPAEKTLQIHYVKVEASAENVFRYELALTPDGALTVAIDDLSQGRQVRKSSEKPIAAELRASLARRFANAGFFEMEPHHEGIPRENTWNTFTLTGIVDGRAATVVVRNRLEPAAFKELREAIETFARNELGLWAIEFPSERLLELATENIARARRHYDERAIRLDNLYHATRTYRSALAYLETIEPKPEIFDAAATELAVAEAELDTLFKDKNWQADHAMTTKNWELASSTLRELMDIIPDRADERHRDVERRLLDVESRIRKLKK
ncbi:MAG: FHA domain-containing protein [Kiritimatiellia bacterium]|jgi:hypothetical protein